MHIEFFNIFVVASFMLLLFSAILWLVQIAVSLYREPLLLQGRYGLFRLRDELRSLYIRVQRGTIKETKFCDADFKELESRINNAINVLPLLSKRFIYLYLEGDEIQRRIEEKENIRKQILEKYRTTSIGCDIETIDKQMGDILYASFCLNSPVYVAIHYLAFRWQSSDYKAWHSSLKIPQIPAIEVPFADAGLVRTLTRWNKVPA